MSCRRLLCLTALAALLLLPACRKEAQASRIQAARDGSAAQPLAVMLVPADGGTEEGTRADFEPIFGVVGKATGLNFEVRVGQSYNAVVQAMANRQVDVAFFGPVSYEQARKQGAAELLAVAERKGGSVYFSGIFVGRESTLQRVSDLEGRSMAFGDVNSTSSFAFPVAMLLGAGVDPVADLDKVFLTGSHANSLQALAGGKVDAACASVDSFEKAVRAGQIKAEEVRLLQKSDPIPYPPLALHPALPAKLKDQLRKAFHTVHQQEGVRPEMLRGYGGGKVDRYNAGFPQAQFDAAMQKLAGVTDELKAELLRKVGQR